MSEKTVPTAQKAAAKKAKGPLVYCGPTVRGVAKQFTVYTNGIPSALEKYMTERPEARSLLVPVERMPQTRENLRKKGTAEAVIFEKLMK